MRHDGPGPVRRAGLPATAALAVGGSVVLLAAAGRTWARVTAGYGGVQPTLVEVTGAQLVPLVAAAGVVGLAALAAVVGTRGVVRRACGVLVLLLGAAVVAVVIAGVAPAHVRDVAARSPEATSTTALTRGEVQRTGWHWAGLAGGLALAGAGGLVAAGGHQWAGLSSRHERHPGGRRPGWQGPDPRTEGTPEQVWEALDRGEDPTV